MIRCSLSLILLVFLITNSFANVRGVIARPYDSQASRLAMYTGAKTMGFNALFLETFYWGRTIFPSKIFPSQSYVTSAPNNDVLAEAIRECHSRGIKVYAWIECFYWHNTGIGLSKTPMLNFHPDWTQIDSAGVTSDNYESAKVFVSPSVPGVQKALQQLITEIGTNYSVDGIMLDYIRYAVDGAGTHELGYDVYGTKRFQSMYGIDPHSITRNTSNWSKWTVFEENEVSKVVHQIETAYHRTKFGRNGIVAASVFPDYYATRSNNTRRQDFVSWASKGYINWLMPMCYQSTPAGVTTNIQQAKAALGTTNVFILPQIAVQTSSTYSVTLSELDSCYNQNLPQWSLFSYDWIGQVTGLSAAMPNYRP